MWGAQDRMKEREVDLVFKVNSVRQLQPGTRQHKKLPADFHGFNTLFAKLHNGYSPYPANF